MDSTLRIDFPENLPVSARREEIMALLGRHQVIIVCGETGSGKTTQLPKIALAMGRGLCNYPKVLLNGKPAPRGWPHSPARTLFRRGRPQRTR